MATQNSLSSSRVGVVLLVLLGVFQIKENIVQSRPGKELVADDHDQETLLPLRILNSYKAQHSVESLLASSEQDENRLFAVAYYSCPFQAGNRLHHFFNSIIWSIVTNRTVLWKYYDQKTCQRVGKDYDRRICHFANTVNDCDETLKRASWIPSLDDYLGGLHSSNETLTLFPLNFWSTRNKPRNPSERHPWTDGNEKYTGVDVLHQHKMVDFPMMLGQDAGNLRTKKGRDYLLRTNASKHIAEGLFSEGVDFLYGMVRLQIL